MFILCCSIALNLHKFEKRRQNYTYFHKPPNFFVSFLHFHSIFPFFLFAVSQILRNFALESIKSSRLWADSPTELNFATVVSTMWEIYSLQKQKVMQQHIYYIRYALQFADMQIPELVTVFNAQVQNRGWSSMRAYHDQALIDEFRRRGIDVSAVYDGNVISFAYPIRYDLPDNKLIAIG